MDGIAANDTVNVEYKYPSGSNYVAATPRITPDTVHNTARYEFSLDNIPDADKTVFVKITFTPATGSLRTILRWEIVNAYPVLFGNFSGNVFEREFNLYDEVVSIFDTNSSVNK